MISRNSAFVSTSGSERSPFDTGLVERAVSVSSGRAHIYPQDGAKWFLRAPSATREDRVVQRENGLYTSISASAISTTLNKYERGLTASSISGADHGWHPG